MFADSLTKPEPSFVSTVTPLDYKIPMVAIKDIGHELATQLTTNEEQPRSPYVFELHGPQEYTPLDVQAAFSKALKKEVAVHPIEQDQLEDFYSKIFPPSIVGEWVEMAKSFLPGSPIMEKAMLPPEDERHVARGVTGLDEAIGDAVARLS